MGANTLPFFFYPPLLDLLWFTGKITVAIYYYFILLPKYDTSFPVTR